MKSLPVRPFVILCILGVASTLRAQPDDQLIEKFLRDHQRQWHDLNVPYEDGQTLYNLIVDHHYTRALEIGTSTGHSTIWLAWALSKTGGKLITLEIDPDRQREALDNLKATGLSAYVEARLGDAHEMVKSLEGPFDFVFSDADKGWYIQYFKDLNAKLKSGGCFTAHNVRNNYGGTKEFVDYIQSLKNYSTTIDRKSSAGISISYKK